MELLRWVAIAVAAFVLVLAVLDLPWVRGSSRNTELIRDCIVEKGAKVAESRDSLRFARPDVTAGRLAEVGGTTLGDDEVAVRLAPIGARARAYELVLVAERPFNALAEPDQIRRVVNDPGSFPLVAYMEPADDSRGRRFWDCVEEARSAG